MTQLPDEATVRARLDRHFELWLGAVAEPGTARLVIATARDEPGWDGKVRPIQGVTGPEGAVLAVSPRFADRFSGLDLEGLFAAAMGDVGHDRLEALIGLPVSYGMPHFRWAERPADLPDAGVWVERDDPRIPAWLRPFNGGVLAAFGSGDEFMAGVGLKQHDTLAREISVATEPAHRGQGLATRLVAQAARRIIADGGVPLYQFAGENPGSAHVADAAGLPDRGWYMLEIHPGQRGDVRG